MRENFRLETTPTYIKPHVQYSYLHAHAQTGVIDEREHNMIGDQNGLFNFVSIVTPPGPACMLMLICMITLSLVMIISVSFRKVIHQKRLHHLLRFPSLASLCVAISTVSLLHFSLLNERFIVKYRRARQSSPSYVPFTFTTFNTLLDVATSSHSLRVCF